MLSLIIESIIVLITNKNCDVSFVFREPPVRQHLTNVYACLALSTVVAGIGAYVDIVTSLASTNFIAAIVGVGLLLGLTSTQDNGKNRYMRLGLLLGFSFCSGLYVFQFKQI